MLRFCVVPCKMLLFRLFLQFLNIFWNKVPHTSSTFLLRIIKVISKSWKSYGRPWKGVKGLAKVRWSSIFIFIICFAITSTISITLDALPFRQSQHIRISSISTKKMPATYSVCTKSKWIKKITSTHFHNCGENIKFREFYCQFYVA